MKNKTAQQSVHLTLGILRTSQAIFYALSFFWLDGFAVPAPAQVSREEHTGRDANRSASKGNHAHNTLQGLLAIQAAWTLMVAGCASNPNSRNTTVSGTEVSYTLQHRNNHPFVVFQAGLGDGQDTWKSLTPALKDIPTFTYDRPGYGLSGKAHSPRNPCAVATEMRDLLHQIGLQPPFILVGHSIGGLYQFVFAQMYPAEVASLVLLDPTHPRHWQTMLIEAPLAAATLKILRYIVFKKAARLEFDEQETCLSALPSGYAPQNAILLFSSDFKVNAQGTFESMIRNLRKDWSKLLPMAQSIEVPAVGHYIHLDQPQYVASIIKQVHAAAMPNKAYT